MMGSSTVQRSGELAFGDKLRARRLWTTEENSGLDIPSSAHIRFVFKLVILFGVSE